MNNLDSITQALSQYTDRVTKEIKEIVAQSAKDIAEAARQKTSEAMGAAITTQVADDGLSATVTVASPYAPLVEYGVSIPAIKPHNAKALHFTVDGQDVFAKSAQAHTTPPKPFLNPAFEENRQKVIDNIANTLQQ